MCENIVMHLQCPSVVTLDTAYSANVLILFFLQMMVWWFTTFMAPAIKEKVISISGIEYLYSVISPKELEIPAFITEYDMTVR